MTSWCPVTSISLQTPFVLSLSKGEQYREVPFMVGHAHHERIVKGLLKHYTRRLGDRYRQKIVDMGSWISKRGAGDLTCRTGRRGRRPYEEKIAAPKGPPLPGEVPDEA